MGMGGRSTAMEDRKEWSGKRRACGEAGRRNGEEWEKNGRRKTVKMRGLRRPGLRKTARAASALRNLLRSASCLLRSASCLSRSPINTNFMSMDLNPLMRCL